MSSGSKASYTAIVGINLGKRNLGPGDEIMLTLRNEDGDMYTLCRRLKEAFLRSFYFFPQSIAIHPDHLDILKKQGRSLEILIDEEAVDGLREIVDLLTLPTQVDLVADATLDLFTAKASYVFDKKQATRMIQDMLKTFS